MLFRTEKHLSTVNINNQMDKTYRLVTFNCKNVKRSLEDIRELCRSFDLIALQETWLLPGEVTYLNSIDEDFNAAGTSAVDTAVGMLRGRPYGGVAILWKKSVFCCVTVIDCDNPRLCAVKIVLDKRHILVISVYMPTDKLDNLVDFTDCLGEVSAIVEGADCESVFILGDLNAHPNSLFYTELADFCTDCDWTIADTEFLGVSSETYTFISDAHGSRRWLDHCVVTEGALKSIVKVDVKYGTYWSDHFPLCLEIDLGIIRPKVFSNNMFVKGYIDDHRVIWGHRDGCQTDMYEKCCHNILRLMDYPEELRDCCFSGFCSDIEHRNIINRMYTDIVDALGQAAVSTYRGAGMKRGKDRRIVGWNKHVGDAHRQAKLDFNAWNAYGKPSSGHLYEAMCLSRKIFKSKLKWCQNHQDQIKMDLLASYHSKCDFKSFWKSTNKLNSAPGLPVSINGVTDPGAIAELFKDHFEVKSPLGPSSSMLDAQTSCDDSFLVITAKDVARVIKHMSKGKSPGHDGLSIEHLRHAGPHLPRVLAMFYSLCLRHSYLPVELMKTVVVPIVKSKVGDISDKNNYRPISLATIIAKVLDGLLDTQLDKYLTLHDNQFGFKPGLSTESAILSLKHVVSYYTTRRTPVFACFLDLSKAFDLVDYDLLWKKLRECDVPVEIINMFKYWYSNQVNNVRWAGRFSSPYRLQSGVRQGGLTSPKLFNIYINALIVALSSQHVGCHIDDICVNNLSYADDMVLLSASVGGLKTLLNTCVRFAERHGLIYNAKKSEIMVFRPRARLPTDVPPIMLNGVQLKRVTQFKYLGHLLTEDLKDDADIERERRALAIRANMLARRFARCTREVKITLFRAYCTSLYTCSLWARCTRKSLSALRVQYNDAFRVMLRLARRCSASGMFAEARTACFYTTVRRRCASLASRVRASRNTILSMIADRFDCPYMNHCMLVHVKRNGV
ncbi:uncharacterized protein [Choristoneura fumiferana]|uniref:uncharacterized protein n=1 Tax=Choristoneura fumiferana TaxID=7141 RepID=UPI003D15B745